MAPFYINSFQLSSLITVAKSRYEGSLGMNWDDFEKGLSDGDVVPNAREAHEDVDSDAVGRTFLRELAKHEDHRSEQTEWSKPSAEGMTITPMHFADKFKLQAFERIARHLATGAGKLTHDTGPIDGCTVRLTRLGRRLAMICNFFEPDLLERHSRHVFNPWIKVMVAALRRWHHGHRFAAASRNVSAEDRKRLGCMARYVRWVCRSRAFRLRIQKEQQLALQDFRSARDYVISLFTSHSRLLILRIDLYYCGEGREAALSDEACAAFERFIRMVRRGRIVPGVLGCLFSREVGVERGVHFHLMVVVDGHSFWDADGHTRTIGERWIKDYAGPGRGTFFNCYARRNEYEYNGLGLVDLSDWRKLMGIRLALEYMTKADYLVRLGGGKRKNFRRGLIKKVGVKRGAPRQREHDLATVRQILGESGGFCRSK